MTDKRKRKKRRGIHFAKVENSARLQRVLKMLRRGGAYTTRQLIRGADVCAMNSIASELRKNGFRVACFRKNVKQKPVWFYMLEGKL
jgi:hypothetical protein